MAQLDEVYRSVRALKTYAHDPPATATRREAIRTGRQPQVEGVLQPVLQLQGIESLHHGQSGAAVTGGLKVACQRMERSRGRAGPSPHGGPGPVDRFGEACDGQAIADEDLISDRPLARLASGQRRGDQSRHQRHVDAAVDAEPPPAGRHVTRYGRHCSGLNTSLRCRLHQQFRTRTPRALRVATR